MLKNFFVNRVYLYDFLLSDQQVACESSLNTSITLLVVLFEFCEINKISFREKRTMISEISKSKRNILNTFNISIG